MVQEAIDGLTDQQIADLELQESGLVSGQNADTIAYTPFAQRMNPQPASAPEPEEPVALSEFQLNQLEEENYRRIDYVMTPQEFDQYWDRRDKEDREVGRFFEGLGQGAAGLIGMVPETGRELQGAMVGMVTDPVNQVQRNVQTGAEIIRKGGINLVQLFDWVGSKVDDLATGSKRAEAINAGIMDRLIADGKMTGNRKQDEQIYQAALGEAREAGAYTPTLDQAREDKGKAYERYVREKALERDFANVSEFRTGEGQMSVPTSAGTYQITDEQPMPTISTLGSMVVDPLNALPLGAGALSKARVLRRIANLSEKPLQGAERVASGLADVAERVELGISTRLQDITGLTQKQQAALGAGVAGTAVYVDSATDGGGGITKAVLMAGAVMPALHYGGGLLRKVGSAAGGAATIVREAGVGGLGVARAEAASSLAGNAAVPERYRKFFTGYVDGTDSTLKRVAQESGNPEALRRMSRFADRMGATQVARAADDVVSGAVTAGIVGSPFAALQPDAERAGEVMGGILALGGVGGLAGGVARRAGTAADADIARMFADVQAVGGNVEAFARLPHATLDRLSAMQGVLAGKVDFVPLTGDEYRMNADIAQNGGEATAGVFLDRDANNRARVFINLDGKTATDAIAPHEIGHAILTSNILDGQPRNDLRNLVNQQYGPEGVEARGREYIARMVDADLRQGATGEAPTVLTEAEMKAMDGGKTMDDIVAERAKDPAERDRLINERVEEFRQRSIDKGEDALDWARDEIIAETFASEAPAIDFRAIRRDALFPRLAESMLSAGGRVLEVMGARLDPGTGKLMDSPSVLFRDNPLFQDRIMQKRVREYVRSYDQYLAGLEEAGAKELRGVELARSSKPDDLARSTHVKLRDEGNGVLENDFLFQKPDGTYSLKPQKIITATENARSAQIKTLYDARKFVPVNSQEFGKRKVNGREVVGGPVLPPQFDFFTHFPQHVREFARSMEQSRAEGGSWDIDYNAIGTGASGRYRVTNLGNVRAIQRETVPFGWQVTKANHLLAASLDLNAFRASAMKAINKGDLGLFNNDMRQVEADLKTYLANHRNGRPGEMTIGQQKRDMLNGLIGTGTAVQRTANPLYSDLNPRGSIRTWRVDRLNDAKPTGRTGYFFDYDKINNNRMPSALPQSGMAMPDVAVVPERFTGTGQEPNRQSRFAQPPSFFARFPIESYERGGKFFDAQSGEDLTGRSYGAGFIDVSSGKPRLFVDGDPAAQPAKSGRTYRTNLFKQKAGWKWISDNAPATSTIVSVEGGGQHVYALRADFEGGVDLARYSDKPSEPRLRPTARGELSLGNEVGRISIRGKEHPVYDGARVARPAAARGQAMPDMVARPERADIPLNPRARQAAFISDRGEVRATGRATHFETNEDLGPDFLAIGAGHLGEDGFFRFGSQSMDDAMGESPAASSAAAARYNQSVYDQGRRPSSMLEEPPGLERPAAPTDQQTMIQRNPAGDYEPLGMLRKQPNGKWAVYTAPMMATNKDGTQTMLPPSKLAEYPNEAKARARAEKEFFTSLPLQDAKQYLGPREQKAITEAQRRIAEVAKNNPEAARLEVTRDDRGLPKVGLIEDADGNPVLDERGNQKFGAIYRKAKYGLREAPGLSKDEARAVQQAADLMEADARRGQANPSIANGIGWYGRMRGWLQQAYGATIERFGQLLGATSARTPVDTNFIQAREALQLFGRGAYDELLQRFDAFVMQKKADADSGKMEADWRRRGGKGTFKLGDEYRKQVNSFKEVPLRANGKKYNANSTKVLHALYGNWISQTKGPKTPNFAGNLTGRTFKATIDVWAARNLRRLLYQGKKSRWRILPEQEQGVTDADFFFSQKVYDEVAKRMGVIPDDLQALQWFNEKDVWEANGWTDKTGAEKSSFDKEAGKLNLDRYQVGLTTFQDASNFDPAVQRAELTSFRDSIRAQEGLEAARVTESEGLYGNVVEPTFDAEFSVNRKGEVSPSIEPIIRQAIDTANRNKQNDVFISAVVEETHPNARPMVEVGFKTAASRAEIDAVTAVFRGAGIDGFTVARNERGDVLGIRAQYVPEISARYDTLDHLDPAKFGDNTDAWMQKAKAAIDSLKNQDNVSYRKEGYVSTNVYGIEEYSSVTPSDILRSSAKEQLGRRRAILEAGTR
jgi:hypothetical protein